MGAIFAVVAKVTAIPAVAQLVQRLTAKLLGNQGVEAKVTATVAPAVILEIVKLLLLAVAPELGALVVAQEANLLAASVAVGAFIAYFTKNEKPV